MTNASARFTSREKNELLRRFEGFECVKVWSHQDVATVHMFGGHYYIKKRGDGTYSYRWASANAIDDIGFALVNVARLADIR